MARANAAVSWSLSSHVSRRDTKRTEKSSACQAGEAEQRDGSVAQFVRPHPLPTCQASNKAHSKISMCLAPPFCCGTFLWPWGIHYVARQEAFQ